MMTQKERAAMQQALEALEVYEIKLNSRLCNEAITALRAALAEQEEQSQLADATLEPVAWVTAKESFCGFPKLVFSETQKDGYKPLYATPVRTKDPCNPLQDLTDDEIDKIVAESTGLLYLDFARAVIAADREKNK